MDSSSKICLQLHAMPMRFSASLGFLLMVCCFSEFVWNAIKVQVRIQQESCWLHFDWTVHNSSNTAFDPLCVALHSFGCKYPIEVHLNCRQSKLNTALSNSVFSIQTKLYVFKKWTQHLTGTPVDMSVLVHLALVISWKVESCYETVRGAFLKGWRFYGAPGQQ